MDQAERERLAGTLTAIADDEEFKVRDWRAQAADALRAAAAALREL